MSDFRTLAKKGRRALRDARTKIFRRAGLLQGDWKAALSDEMKFWEWALRDGGKNWDQGEWGNATNPHFALQPELQAIIPAPPESMVRILDVGSGLLTRVGKVWPGREVQITPADPLADQYNALLANLSIRPLVPSVSVHGEKLLEKFAPDFFDLAYASNSLDHSYDPVLVIKQMIAVTKPGHYVYLWHVANEGVREGYQGLHQWNFDIVKGEFVVGDGRTIQSVVTACGQLAEVTAEFREAWGAKIVVAKLKKRPVS